MYNPKVTSVSLKTVFRWLGGGLGVLLVLLVLGATGLLLFRKYESHRVTPDIATEGTLETLSSRIGQRFSAQAADATVECQRIADSEVVDASLHDGWGKPIATTVDACASGGCLIQLRSAGKDGEMQTSDDQATAPMLRGDCSSQDFQNQRLMRLDAQGAILVSANFAGAELRGASFDRSNLEEAEFEGAQLGCPLGEWFRPCATFREANLKAASFAHTRLFRIDMSQATLHSTNFRGAELEKVNFKGAQLHEVSLEAASMRQLTCPDGTHREQGWCE